MLDDLIQDTYVDVLLSLILVDATCFLEVDHGDVVSYSLRDVLFHLYLVV